MGFERHLLPDPVSYFEAEGLTLKGPSSSKWKTSECRFHGGRDSMRINIASGAWVCMNCGAKGGDILSYAMQAHGIEFVEAVKSLGAWVGDGKAPPPNQKPPSLPPRAALQVLAFEAQLVAIEASRIGNGITPTADDLSRIRAAANHIMTIAREYE